MRCVGFPGGSDGKESTCNVGNWVLSLDWEDSLEKGMATHSSICLENSMDRGAWRAMVLGVAKSQTQLSNFQKNTILFEKKKEPLRHQ